MAAWERNDENWVRKVEKVESMVMAGVGSIEAAAYALFTFALIANSSIACSVNK